MRPPSTPAPLLALLLCLCAACGEGDPKALTDRGTAALGAGRDAEAIESFDRALAGLDPASADWLRASLGRCRALARSQPAKAKGEFLALAKAHPTRVQEQDFGQIVDELVREDAIVEAIDVMDAGIKLHPESPGMQQVRARVLEASQKAQSPEALDKLKGLGYVGD